MSELISAIGLCCGAMCCGMFFAYGVYAGIMLASRHYGPLKMVERNRVDNVYVRQHCQNCDGEIGGPA